MHLWSLSSVPDSSGAFTEETPSPIWTSPHVKADVLMMGIAEGDQITDGNWDA